MPKAEHDITTHRRSFLRLAAATPALSLPAFLGVQAVPAEARAATPAPGDDAELLGLCTEFHQQHAAVLATPSIDGEDALTAALYERWDISDEILVLVPQTDAGRRAKAHVALVLLVENQGDEPTSSDSIFVLATLQDIVGRAAA